MYLKHINRLAISLLLAILLVSTSSAAKRFSVPLDKAEWITTTSNLMCELTQPIPYYGNAVFTKQAGRRLVFTMELLDDVPPNTKATISVQPTSWQHHQTPERLGQVDILAAQDILQLKEKMALRLLAALEQGKSPVFSYQAPSGHLHVQIVLSALKFMPAYQEYLACLHNLLPHAFDDVRFTTIYFDSDDYRLDDMDKAQLSRIRNYVMQDQDVAKIVIKGYSDSRGKRSRNAFLSSSRADVAESFLLERGVPQEKIETYSLGDEDPIASNDTAEGRAKNRRVTIELIK